MYNGRTSSLVVSGTPVVRPCGIFPSKDGKPTFQPEAHLDFELEMGVFISTPVPRGQRLDINKAKDHIFGMVMLNDWSSRDIQFYEMQPLGPFHSKGSATTISPWVVTIEALEESASCARKTPQDPQPPPHLTWKDDSTAVFDIQVSVKVQRECKTLVNALVSLTSQKGGSSVHTLGESNLNELYWTPFQQITHLGAAGEGLSTGDLFGTGTISSAVGDTSSALL